MKISKYTLKNGLRIVHVEDKSTMMSVVNLTYHVGSKNECSTRTGLAHLLEHLMFSGSKNAPNFDNILQYAGAENNAWTSQDITNYYEVIPTENIEIAFWLEADRMFQLNLTEEKLQLQKNVVIEEFKQQYLSNPYGDLYPLMSQMIYKKHPYRWLAIGLEPSHIENVTLDEVRSFYKKYYCPNNAVLSVIGNIDAEKTFLLAEKYFGEIPSYVIPESKIEQEPNQLEFRVQRVERDVPFPMLLRAYRIPKCTHPEFVVCDLLSDVLANGNSARLSQNLMHEKHVFSSIDAYVDGKEQDGLFYFIGQPADGITIEESEKYLEEEILKIATEKISDFEMEKVKNKYESNKLFSELSIKERVSRLGYWEIIDRAERLLREIEDYKSVSAEKALDIAQEIFSRKNSSTLFYHNTLKN